MSERSCACDRCAAPAPLNPPGLPALRYRCGTHASFLRQALRELPRAALPDDPGARPLAALTTRALDDPAVALLDAWAVVADVLTFYDERIANEGFLRTATERRSVLELARAIGYELAPGLAATTYLAFVLEDARGAPRAARVPRGTRALSAPAESKPPQPFETDEEIVARPSWNALRVRRRFPQAVSDASTAVTLAGGDLGIRPGDVMTWKIGAVWYARRAASIVEEETPSERAGSPPTKRTVVRFGASGDPTLSDLPDRTDGELASELAPLPFTAAAAEARVFQRCWSEADLQAFLALHKWDEEALLAHAAARPAPAPGVVVHLGERAGFFGHNAPLWANIPEGTATRPNPYLEQPTYDWDTYPRTLRQDWKGDAYPESEVLLERVMPGVQVGDPLVIDTGSVLIGIEVTRVRETSIHGFGLSSRVHALQLQRPELAGLFLVRASTAHVRARRLPLADATDASPLPAGAVQVPLDRMTLGLGAGRRIAIVGESAEAPGVTVGEVVEVQDAIHENGLTTLHLKQGLSRAYVRATVAINANVAPASHGETVKEILGSASAAQPHARFRLKRPPLAHVPAAKSGGARAVLELRVGGLRWDEVPTLYASGPHDPHYELRIDDDGGVEALLGDGARGAIPPTGADNVLATYRTGGGAAGNVEASSIQILQSRPLGVKDVSNPVKADGGSAPEPLDRARENAPLKVKTLDRVVSLRDHEDFARAFAGIGKASAVAVWSGRDRLVLVTVAAAAGPLSENVRTSLVGAIDGARHPVRHVVVKDHAPRRFRLAVNVLPDPRAEAGPVLARVRAALVEAFSFDRRDLAQPVTASEVVALVHAVPDVVACDLAALHLAEGSPPADPVQSVIPARPGRFDGALRPAELLLLDPGALDVGLLEVP